MRKKPQQVRSQEMVETLLQATARAIGRHGLALTTRHIAEEAGVSAGSLYQYFEDKEALLEALTLKMGRQIAEVAQRQLAAGIEQDLRTLFRNQLTEILALICSNEGYLAMARHWHELRTLDAVNIAEQDFLEAFRMYLLRHHSEYRFDDLPATIFIAYSSTALTTIRYLGMTHPPFSRESLIDGLTNMVVGYLEQGRDNSAQRVVPPAQE